MSTFTDTSGKVMEAKIERWAGWAQRLSDDDLTARAKRLEGAYFDRMGPKQFAVLIERRRRLGRPE